MSTVNKPDLRLTYQQYVLFPDDGNRHEIINGDHYMSSAPTTYHQTVSKRLQYELYTKIELAGHGQVFKPFGKTTFPLTRLARYPSRQFHAHPSGGNRGPGICR